MGRCIEMKLPKASKFALLGIALCLLGSISIAPNATRRTVTRKDGTDYTELDTWKYIRGNWFGFGSTAVGGICLVVAVIRRIRND
jgi:hypothetical protein